MTTANFSSLPVAAPLFIDRRQVRWAELERAEHALYQSFSYRYPGPITELSHQLMVKPRATYGLQRLENFELAVTPPLIVTESSDPFGNAILEVAAPELGPLLEFHLRCTLTLTASRTPLRLSAAEAAPFFEPTLLTEADAPMKAAARDLRRAYAGPLAFAAALNDWVFHQLRYGFGATDTRTPAATALRGGVGLCQDYAHIMVAMCRSVGIPARYVSGHMIGEGGSHAWSEVLIPEGGGYAVYGFDPTNRRRPGFDHLIVAVGRDYSDVPPTAGSFSAPYGGELSFSKQAGLTRLEYKTGEVVTAG